MTGDLRILIALDWVHLEHNSAESDSLKDCGYILTRSTTVSFFLGFIIRSEDKRAWTPLLLARRF